MGTVKSMETLRTQLTKKELESIQIAHREFNSLKMALAEAELNKMSIAARIRKVQDDFQKIEGSLIKRYGKDAVIDIQTGEVKRPSQDDQNSEVPQ